MSAGAGAHANRAARDVARVLALGGLSIVAIWILLMVMGYDAGAALIALWRGSLGSWYAFGSATLVRATPLMLAGLAVAVAFRAGVFNIGAEGQLLAGAVVATAIGLGSGAALGRASMVLALIGGALAGLAWAGIAAWLRHRYRVLEVISTIMLNFVALHAVGWLVRGPLQEPSGIYPQSSSIDVATRLPRVFPDARAHLGLLLALVACVSIWWMLRSTAAGFRLRAAGSNPFAARMAGMIDVDRTTLFAFLLSGAFAGLAGASEVGGVTFALYENISPGYGYTAIAVALLARLHPLGVIATGVLFGALEAGAAAMQRDAGVPSVVVSIIEAALILAVLALERTRWRSTVAAEAGT
jgi:general nucleoside transport system permease protein